MSIVEAIEVLRTLTNDFSVSLVSQYDRKGALSDKQAYWALSLAEEASTPKPPSPVKVDLMAIVAFFSNALETLAKPKLTFKYNGVSFRLTVSNNGQSIFVAEPVWQGLYYGKISIATGEFTAGRDCNQNVVDFLTDFAVDPITKSADYGKLTGNCCFCNKKLERKESIAYGYGPSCAERWGMPHHYKSKGSRVTAPKLDMSVIPDRRVKDFIGIPTMP